jgi:hypothetical protein
VTTGGELLGLLITIAVVIVVNDLGVAIVAFMTTLRITSLQFLIHVSGRHCIALYQTELFFF